MRRESTTGCVRNAPRVATAIVSVSSKRSHRHQERGGVRRVDDSSYLLLAGVVSVHLQLRCGTSIESYEFLTLDDEHRAATRLNDSVCDAANLSRIRVGVSLIAENDEIGVYLVGVVHDFLVGLAVTAASDHVEV